MKDKTVTLWGAATENYTISDIWYKSAVDSFTDINWTFKIIKDEIVLSSNEKVIFMNKLFKECIDKKIELAINRLEEFYNTCNNNDIFIYSDCDIQFFKHNHDGWNKLFDKLNNDEYSMACLQEGNINNINGGFMIVNKKGALQLKECLKATIILIKITNLKFYEQDILNILKDYLFNYFFIPDELVIWGPNINDVNKYTALLHHAVCTETHENKIDQIANIGKAVYEANSYKKEVVVAHYNENLNWIRYINLPYENIHVYSKGTETDMQCNQHFLENVGREAHTYLSYIVERYDSLPDYVIFTQGKIDDHYINIDSLIKSEEYISNNYSHQYFNNGLENFRLSYYKGIIDSSELPGDKWFEKYINNTIDVSNNKINIYWAAIFSVSKNAILSRPIDYYKMLLKLVSKSNAPEEAHYLERSWYYIFNPNTNTIVNTNTNNMNINMNIKSIISRAVNKKFK